MQPFERDELASLFEDVDPEERHLPNIDIVDWGVLDYFGWIHPSGHLGYVALRIDGEATGLVLRRMLLRGQARRTQMCAWCHLLHRSDGVAMFSGTVDGSDGRKFIGLNLCRALDCSLRLRNLTGDTGLRMPETIDLVHKIQRLEDSVTRYVRRVRPTLRPGVGGVTPGG